jgi:crossover junction endodeoxyribonuclease RusA
MSNSVTLPWPAKELSPNARMHWAQKAKFAKAYRMACFTLCLQAKLAKPETEGRLHLWLDFYPPDRRHRDDDNMIASFKAGRDGIADALGVDDKRFVCHPFVSDQIGGMVKVRVTVGPTPCLT